jgi:hypothetical protein
VNYLEVLYQLHRRLAPEVYLEIGVQYGVSLQLSHSRTIGIDPAMRLSATMDDKPWLKLYQTTSDAFFQDHMDWSTLEGKRLGLAFIDGLHLFEQVLRDFIHVERWSSPDTVIAVHDVLPPDLASTSRTPHGGVWVGDVWKLVVCLAEYRADLVLDVLDAPPSGLLLVRRPDATSTVLSDHYEQIVEHYVTALADPDAAVAAYLANVPVTAPKPLLKQAFPKASKRSE